MGAKTIEKTAGTYYLHGVKETASGFKLNADGTFPVLFYLWRIGQVWVGQLDDRK